MQNAILDAYCDDETIMVRSAGFSLSKVLLPPEAPLRTARGCYKDVLPLGFRGKPLHGRSGASCAPGTVCGELFFTAGAGFVPRNSGISFVRSTSRNCA